MAVCSMHFLAAAVHTLSRPSCLCCVICHLFIYKMNYFVKRFSTGIHRPTYDITLLGLHYIIDASPLSR